MVNSSRILLIIFIFCYFSQAQVVKRDEKVRFSFGLTEFTSGRMNDLLSDLEQAARANTFVLPISSFDVHLIFQLDYEKALGSGYYYMFGLQYGQEVVSGDSSDRRNQIEQGLDYSLTLLQASASIVRYFPLHVLQKGAISVVVGAGLELMYANADLLYVYYHLPVQYQKIDFVRSGFMPGVRGLVGLEAPMTPSILLQLRSGFSYIPGGRLTGKVKSENLDTPTDARVPIDPDVLINNDNYNFGQLWLTFGLAYFF
jgi:hypothetical protein